MQNFAQPGKKSKLQMLLTKMKQMIIIAFHFICCNYSSDITMEPNQHENLSESPIPPVEADALNNNRHIDANSPRKSLSSPTQCKIDIPPRSMSGRPAYNSRDVVLAPVDSRLNDWLNTLAIDSFSRNIILAEQFTYDDFIYGMEKTDLYRIGLK